MSWSSSELIRRLGAVAAASGRAIVRAARWLRLIADAPPAPRMRLTPGGAVVVESRDRLEIRDRDGARAWWIRPMATGRHELVMATAATGDESLAVFPSARAARRALADLARSMGARQGSGRIVWVIVGLVLAVLAVRAVATAVVTAAPAASQAQSPVLPHFAPPVEPAAVSPLPVDAQDPSTLGPLRPGFDASACEPGG